MWGSKAGKMTYMSSAEKLQNMPIALKKILNRGART